MTHFSLLHPFFAQLPFHKRNCKGFNIIRPSKRSPSSQNQFQIFCTNTNEGENSRKTVEKNALSRGYKENSDKVDIFTCKKNI